MTNTLQRGDHIRVEYVADVLFPLSRDEQHWLVVRLPSGKDQIVWDKAGAEYGVEYIPPPVIPSYGRFYRSKKNGMIYILGRDGYMYFIDREGTLRKGGVPWYYENELVEIEGVQ